METQSILVRLRIREEESDSCSYPWLAPPVICRGHRLMLGRPGKETASVVLEETRELICIGSRRVPASSCVDTCTAYCMGEHLDFGLYRRPWTPLVRVVIGVGAGVRDPAPVETGPSWGGTCRSWCSNSICVHHSVVCMSNDIFAIQLGTRGAHCLVFVANRKDDPPKIVVQRF